MIRADDRSHLQRAVLERHFADRAAFAVGDDRATCRRTTGRWAGRTTRSRLRTARAAAVAIDDVFAAVAGVRADLLFIERHLPNLMAAGHRDVQVLVVNAQVPRGC